MLASADPVQGVVRPEAFAQALVRLVQLSSPWWKISIVPVLENQQPWEALRKIPNFQTQTSRLAVCPKPV